MIGRFLLKAFRWEIAEALAKVMYTDEYKVMLATEVNKMVNVPTLTLKQECDLSMTSGYVLERYLKRAKI